MNQDNPDIEKKGVERLQERIQESPLLNIEQRKHWLILLTSLCLITLLIIWSFLGRIPIESEGRGVSISADGVFLLESPSAGTLSEIYLTEGATATRGAPIAKFNNPQLNSILSSIEANKFKIERLHTQSLLIQKALSINLGLFKQGLIAKMVIDQTRSELMQKNIEVENAKSELSAAFTELEQNSFVKKSQFNHYKSLLEAPSGVVEYEEILKELSTLRAPSDGKVLEVLINPGELVTKGEAIFWMEHPALNHETTFYGTINSETAGRLRAGLKVLIEPANVNSKEYGVIIGKIEGVYPYPVSKEELVQTVGNKQIVSYLLDEGKAITQVTITPEKDPQTKSGYKWTSKEGPPYEVPTGTLAKMTILVEEQPPISYLIPLWKLKSQ
ncbi:MAG: hypothetical protein K940chlam2_00248 [Chlamydiae bacterium]|nr:hypothetical protein [Chlamydiota bacterium]